MRGIIRAAMTGLEQLKGKRVTLCLTHFLIEQWLPFGKPTNSGGQKERRKVGEEAFNGAVWGVLR
jgi:hypothetical protein